MALIDCPECSKSISDKSAACPHCGYPMSSHNIPTPNNSQNRRPNQNRKRKKNSGCSGTFLFIILVIGAILYAIIKPAYDNYKERVALYSKTSSESYEETQQIEASQPEAESPQAEEPEPLLDSDLTPITMSLSGSGENGRYFLISHFTSYGLEHIKYVRRGKDSDAYGEMQIDCTKNEIRKVSSESLKALQSATLGDWYTPTPDWTDKDIYNFVCQQ